MRSGFFSRAKDPCAGGGCRMNNSVRPSSSLQSSTGAVPPTSRGPDGGCGDSCFLLGPPGVCGPFRVVRPGPDCGPLPRATSHGALPGHRKRAPRYEPPSRRRRETGSRIRAPCCRKEAFQEERRGLIPPSLLSDSRPSGTRPSTGRLYRLERTMDLKNGPWTPVFTDIPGTGADILIPSFNPENRLYFRIGVSTPP